MTSPADLIAEARTYAASEAMAPRRLTIALADALEAVMADRRILTAQLMDARDDAAAAWAEASSVPYDVHTDPEVVAALVAEHAGGIVIEMANGPNVIVHSEEQAAAFRAAAAANAEILARQEKP